MHIICYPCNTIVVRCLIKQVVATEPCTWALANYGTALRQCHTHWLSIDWVSFQVNWITCSSSCGLKCSHALRSMVVPLRHGALKWSNWHKLPLDTQTIWMIECERVSARTETRMKLSLSDIILHKITHQTCKTMI